MAIKNQTWMWLGLAALGAFLLIRRKGEAESKLRPVPEPVPMPVPEPKPLPPQFIITVPEPVPAPKPIVQPVVPAPLPAPQPPVFQDPVNTVNPPYSLPPPTYPVGSEWYIYQETYIVRAVQALPPMDGQAARWRYDVIRKRDGVDAGVFEEFQIKEFLFGATRVA